jgi:hypothetical protein
MNFRICIKLEVYGLLWQHKPKCGFKAQAHEAAEAEEATFRWLHLLK